MADDKKEKKDQDGSLDFFLNFMKKRTNENTSKQNKNEKPSKKGIKNNLIDGFTFFIDAINHVIEDILMDDRKSKWFSLLMAVVLFVSVSGQQLTTVSQRTVEDVPVEVMNLDENLAVSGVPTTVDLTLSGNIVNLQSALYREDYQAYINLSGYGEGSYAVDIQVDGLPSGITVRSSPGVATVNLSQKQSRVFALGYRFINEDKKDARYILEPPIMSKSEVTVIAGEDTLNEIVSVEAVIDVANITSHFTQQAKLKAYDAMNNELAVEFEPETVDVSVNVTSSSKQVPIQITRVGTMDSSLAIASITPSPSTVTIYGQKEVLDEVESLSASVDVSQVTENMTLYGVNLELPTGVSNVSTDSISVDLVVEPRVIKPMHTIEVSVANNTNNYTIHYTSSLNISVSGASSRMSDLTDSTIQAVIDVKDLEPGEYTLPIRIRSSDSLLDITLPQETMTVTIE